MAELLPISHIYRIGTCTVCIDTSRRIYDRPQLQVLGIFHEISRVYLSRGLFHKAVAAANVPMIDRIACLSIQKRNIVRKEAKRVQYSTSI